MAILSSEKSEINAEHYTPTPGLFKNRTWYFCREEFHFDDIPRNHKFLYVLYPNQNLETIVDVLTEMENLLSVDNEIRLKEIVISKHPELKCLEVDINDNWWDDEVRYNLLTMLLRDINVDLETTKKGKYLSNIGHIFPHFMEGNVFYQNDNFKGLYFTTWKDLKKTSSGKKKVTTCYHSGWAQRERSIQ